MSIPKKCKKCNFLSLKLENKSRPWCNVYQEKAHKAAKNCKIRKGR